MAAKVITVTFKVKPATAALRRLAEEFPSGLGVAVYRFAEEQITTRAKQEFVPVVTGNLRSSIVTGQPVVTKKIITVTVGAGGAAVPYAMAVHENPRAGKTGGQSPSGRPYKRWSRVGQWKYIETPATEASQRLDLFAVYAGQALKESIRGAR